MDSERRALIGNGSGFDTKVNENTIGARGARFPLDIAEALLGTQGVSDEDLIATRLL
jgi:hypothetical protein